MRRIKLCVICVLVSCILAIPINLAENSKQTNKDVLNLNGNIVCTQNIQSTNIQGAQPDIKVLNGLSWIDDNEYNNHLNWASKTFQQYIFNNYVSFYLIRVENDGPGNLMNCSIDFILSTYGYPDFTAVLLYHETPGGAWNYFVFDNTSVEWRTDPIISDLQPEEYINMFLLVFCTQNYLFHTSSTTINFCMVTALEQYSHGTFTDSLMLN